MNILRPEIKGATPADVARADSLRVSSMGDYLSAAASEAWDMTSVSRVGENVNILGAELKEYGSEVKSNPKDELAMFFGVSPDKLTTKGKTAPDYLSKEEWEKSEFNRPGMEYDENMTPVRARIMAENYDSRRERDKIIAKGPKGLGATALYFGTQFAVGMADPINYIPFLGQGAKLKAVAKFGPVLGRAITAGAEGAVSNAVLTPLIYADLAAKGEDISFADYAVDVVFGGAAGGLFGAAGGAFAKMRGETKESVLRALQKATLDVADGKAADVGGVLKELAPDEHFSRDIARERLVANGVDEAEADTFLKGLDEQAQGWATETGQTPADWYRQHIARVDVVDSIDSGIRFNFRDDGHAGPVGLDVSAVKSAVDPIQKDAVNALPLDIVQGVDELPPHIQYELKASGGGAVQGVYDTNTGKVFLVADHLASPNEAVSIWMHEQGLHHGLRGIFGGQNEPLNRLLDDVYNHYGKDSLNGLANAYGLNLDRAGHRRIVAEERLAKMAEKLSVGEALTTAERGMWNRFMVTVRQWLRKKGINVRLTENEIADVIKDSIRWTMKGDTDLKSVARDMRFARDEWGPKFDGYKGKPKEAIAKLKEAEAGYAPEVFFNPEIGNIDLVWGKDGPRGYGLAHILEGHEPQKILDALQGVIRRGDVNIIGRKAEIRLGNNLAVVNLEWSGQKKAWLLTAFNSNERKQRRIYRKTRFSRRSDLAEHKRGEEPTSPSHESSLENRSSKTADLAGHRSAEEPTPSSHGVSSDNIIPNSMKGNGSVEFLPDGRAVINLRRGADIAEAVNGLREVLRNQPTPTAKSVPDFSPERMAPLEFEEPEARDLSEVENELLEELEVMRAEGRITEQDEADILAANQAADRQNRIAEAYEAAKVCLTRGA